MDLDLQRDLAQPSAVAAERPAARQQAEAREGADGRAGEEGQEGPRGLRAFFEASADTYPDSVALEVGHQLITYDTLERAANRLAWHLRRQGVGAGQRIGIFCDRSEAMYTSLLAITKTEAAFVPLDAGMPDERLRFIVQDAQLTAIATDRQHAARLDGLAPIVAVDALEGQLAALPPVRPPSLEGDPAATPCYVIYTSGSTGKPKGVIITQQNITTFLQAVLPVYGVTARDRVYQGVPISFDFSVEEIWPTWAGGATLVAGPTDARRFGSGLNRFLTDRRVSVLHIVPTLLATLDDALPTVRLLNVGGEACPAKLVDRFATPRRRMLNTYGPSETTVTATWTELHPGLPVTIGRALPSHSTHVLDSDLRPVESGEEGELCVGGPCVAAGYFGRKELTASSFVADPFSPTPEARMYRTGDLVRADALGNLEYLGRMDGQVKLRGYRVELGEIEAVIAEDPAVRQSVVAALPYEGRVEELAAYVVLRDRTDIEARPRIHRTLKRRLPSYMVPAYIEVLDALPMLPGETKLDRASLPLPIGPRLLDVESHELPATPTEASLATWWAEVLGAENIPADADFFVDLGGHSLSAALLVARLRGDPALSGLSIADLYRFPTIRELAAYIDAGGARPPNPAPGAAAREPERQPKAARACRRCGTAQLGSLVMLLVILALPGATVLDFSHGVYSPHLIIELELVVAASLILLGTLLPVVAVRRLLRIAPGAYPLWSRQHWRVWLATKLLQVSPIGVLAGSPLLPPYLRLLGARVGPGAQVATPNIALPSFVEIGAGASIGYGADLQPFYVDAGVLHLAPIVVGERAHVGTCALVMAGARLEHDAVLGDLSLLSAGQVIPGGQRWVGSPAFASQQRDPVLEAMRGHGPEGARSRVVGLGYALTALFMLVLPFVATLPAALLLLWSGKQFGVPGAIGFCFVAGPIFVLALCGLAIAAKRLLVGTIPLGTYPVRSRTGLRKWTGDRLVLACLTYANSLFATLYTPPFLRALGAKVGRRAEVSTVAHVDPDALVLEDESFVADMAALGPARFCNGQVAVARAHIGTRSFVGNAALVSSDTHVGPGSLVGVLTTPPPGRPVGPNTDWLGSPAIFLPRRQPSGSFPETMTFHPRRSQVMVRLFIEFVRSTLPASLFALSAVAIVGGSLAVERRLGQPTVFGVLPALTLASAFAIVLVVAGLKWAVVGRYRPRVEPLWAMFVRRSELVTGLYESAAVPALLTWLMGTPLLGPALRLFGARVGRATYLDTTYATEFDLLSVGDEVCVGARASLQTHLFEDRVMKMSTVELADGCSIGSRAVVLYETHVEPGVHVAPLSLVMKGETLPAGTSWYGIPVEAEMR